MVQHSIPIKKSSNNGAIYNAWSSRGKLKWSLEETIDVMFLEEPQVHENNEI